MFLKFCVYSLIVKSKFLYKTFYIHIQLHVDIKYSNAGYKSEHELFVLQKEVSRACCPIAAQLEIAKLVFFLNFQQPAQQPLQILYLVSLVLRHLSCRL